MSAAITQIAFAGDYYRDKITSLISRINHIRLPEQVFGNSVVEYDRKSGCYALSKYSNYSVSTFNYINLILNEYTTFMKDLLMDIEISSGTYNFTGNYDTDRIICKWFKSDTKFPRDKYHHDCVDCNTSACIEFYMEFENRLTMVMNKINYYVYGEIRGFTRIKLGKGLLGSQLSKDLDKMIVADLQSFVNFVNHHRMYETLYLVCRFSESQKRRFMEYLRYCDNTAGIYLRVIDVHYTSMYGGVDCGFVTPCTCSCGCSSCINRLTYMMSGIYAHQLSGGFRYPTDNMRFTITDFAGMVCERWRMLM